MGFELPNSELAGQMEAVVKARRSRISYWTIMFQSYQAGMCNLDRRKDEVLEAQFHVQPKEMDFSDLRKQ